MGARLKLKRGTAAQVQLASLSAYEAIYATDTHECYIYDGTTKQLLGQCMSGDTASRPAAGVPNRIYFNTTTGYLEKDSGSEWVQIATSATHDHSTAEKGGSIPSSSITNFTEVVQDVCGGMVTDNVETGVSAEYDDNVGKLNFAVTDIDGGVLA